MRPASEEETLRKGLVRLNRLRVGARARLKGELAEQPFDRELLRWSRLYRRSRELYLAGGGRYHAALVSSPRTLSSPTLIDPVIQYSPVESELLWSALDPRERSNLKHLGAIRTYVTSVYHEQSHRILWTRLPSPPASRGGVRRYLNFAESLVIALDMALGDELGPARAPTLYLSGATYDRGTDVRRGGIARRKYRNYLHAAQYATYLLLECYSDEGIARAVGALYPGAGSLLPRALARARNLDQAFVHVTNPDWQAKHWRRVARGLARPGDERLEIPEDPADNRLIYLHAEKFFEEMGI